MIDDTALVVPSAAAGSLFEAVLRESVHLAVRVVARSVDTMARVDNRVTSMASDVIRCQVATLVAVRSVLGLMSVASRGATEVADVDRAVMREYAQVLGEARLSTERAFLDTVRQLSKASRPALDATALVRIYEAAAMLDSPQAKLVVSAASHMLGGGLKRCTLAIQGISKTEERPDKASGQHDGF